MASVEIERKFLVPSLENIWSDGQVPDADAATVISQGYLVDKQHRSLRIRLTPDAATLTLKGPREGAVRIEFEESLSTEFGEQLLRLAEPAVVSKIRYPLVSEGRLWAIDRFLDQNDGLVIAEVELTSTTEAITVPSWCGPEVTADDRYYNEYLARTPFTTWS